MATNYSSSYTYKPNTFENALFSFRKKPQPQMSVAPKSQVTQQSVQTKAPTAIASHVSGGTRYSDGSIRTNNMSVNPSAYKSAPKPIPKPQPQPQSTPQANPYLERIRGIADQQSANVSSSTDKYATQMRDSIDRQNTRTASLIPKYQSNFNAYRDSVNQQIADETKLSAMDEQATRDLYGEALRRGAQANRESMGQIQEVFAGLNTLDSNAFNQKMINQQARFAGGQQTTLREQARELQAVKNNLAIYRREAQLAIRGEEERLMERLVEIENTMDIRSTEGEAAIQQAYTDAYNTILAIDENLAGLEKEAEMKERDYEILVREMELKNQSEGGSELKDKQALALSANNALDNVIMTIQNQPDIYRNLNPLDQTKRQYDASVNNAIDLIIRTRTGAAATVDEMNAMRKLFPSYWDDPQTAMKKLNDLKAGVQSNLYGTDFQGTGQQMSMNNRPDINVLAAQYGG